MRESLTDILNKLLWDELEVEDAVNKITELTIGKTKAKTINGDDVSGTYHRSGDMKMHYILNLEKFVEDGDRMYLHKAEVHEIDPKTLSSDKGWISVEDELPKNFETVIVSGGVARYNSETKNWWSLMDVGGTIIWKVTHWMPLPKLEK